MNYGRWIIKIWIFSIGFIYLLDVPYLKMKVQLPELLVLLMLGIWLWSRQKAFWPPQKEQAADFRRFYAFEGATMLWLFIALAASLKHPTRAAFLENMGYAYLFLSSLLVQWWLHQGKNRLRFFQQSFIQLGIILAVLNIAIFGLYTLGWTPVSPLVESKTFPVLGELPRVLGWMPSANLLANLMALCWWMALSEGTSSGKYAASLLILVGLVLTFSKSLLIIVPLGFFLWIKNRRTAGKRSLRFSGAIVIFSAVCYLFFTHALVQPKSEPIDASSSYLTGQILAETRHSYFLETSYLRLKKMQLQAVSENPVLGVGPGNFNAFLQKAKEEELYPEHLTAYDPHSTLGGTLAEMGILGFLALLIWIFVIFRMLKVLVEKKEVPGIYWALAVYIFFLGIEMLTTDVLNFRHLWVCLGMLAWAYKSCFYAAVEQRHLSEME